MAFGRKRIKLNSLHYFEKKALLHQFFCHYVKDAQSIDKFFWVSKWHRTNNGRTIIFWTGVGGGGWKILTCKHFFFISGWLLQTIFCVSVFLQTLFFNRCNLFQCLQPLQTIYFKIFQPSPSPSQTPPSKNNGPSLMAKKKKKLLCQINVIWYDYPLHSRDSLKNRAPARKKRVITAWPAAFEGGYSAAWSERRRIIN